MNSEKKYFAKELIQVIREQEKYSRKVVDKYIEVLEECNELRIAFIKAADARDKLSLELEELRRRVN